MKLATMMSYIIDRKLVSDVAAYAQVVKFQHHCCSHAYCILFLYQALEKQIMRLQNIANLLHA